MRKRGAMLSACLCWVILTMPDFVVAAAGEQPVRVYLDGKQIKFEAQPILENGTTLVQFRPIFEKLGLKIHWDGETRTVTGEKTDLKIELIIDDPNAYVNGRLNKLELAPRLVEGNTFVPIRFVSEASGKEVTWDQNTASIYLKSPTIPKGTANSGGTTDQTKPEMGDYVYPNGDKYSGQLVNGYPEGKGKLYNADGKLLFEGTMMNGVPENGRSKSYYENGQVEMDGVLKDGVYNGSVKQYASDGSLIFNGTFSNGQRDKGTLYYDDGDKYTGPFDNDKPSGSGKIVYENGDVYEGEFVDGNREGKGTYITAKGEKIVGDFQNNMKNGLISYYDKKGNLLSVSEYSNDILISKVDMGNESTTLPDTNSTSQPNPLKIETDRHEKAMNQIKERYNQNRKQVEDQIAQIRKDNPGLYASQTAYDKALQDATAKQTDIIAKINSLAADASNAAAAARVDLEKQLSDTQALIGQITAKGAVQQQIEVLKNQLTLLRDSYNAELKYENEQHTNRVKELKQTSAG